MAEPGFPLESQLSDLTLASGVDESFKHDLAAHLPPVQQWSDATIESIRSNVSAKYPGSEWQEESEWTRRLINVILASQEGWNWQRLKTCSNTEYFSLPHHTIALLNAVSHAGGLDAANACCEAGNYASDLGLRLGHGGKVGFPIFRVDYSSDENFELYKKCWDKFLESEFYVLEAVDRDDVMWYWVDDKAKLDGKGPREVRQIFQSLCGSSDLPYHPAILWLCIIVDSKAMESMLRVYGPPATRISSWPPSNPRRQEILFLPYVTTISTTWNDENRNEVDGEYHGHFLCALECIFRLWEMEQRSSASNYYPRNGGIWAGYSGYVFEAPSLRVSDENEKEPFGEHGCTSFVLTR